MEFLKSINAYVLCSIVLQRRNLLFVPEIAAGSLVEYLRASILTVRHTWGCIEIGYTGSKKGGVSKWQLVRIVSFSSPRSEGGNNRQLLRAGPVCVQSRQVGTEGDLHGIMAINSHQGAESSKCHRNFYPAESPWH